MARTQRRLVLFGVAMLAFIDVVTGLWAVIDPAGWFRDFPGTGAHWIAATPPYNHHLVTDAGAGFLGVGVVLLLAAVWRERRVVQAALLGSLAHDLPHFIFHLLHPAASLSSADRAASTGGLAFGCFVAAALLVLVCRSPAAPGEPDLGWSARPTQPGEVEVAR